MDRGAREDAREVAKEAGGTLGCRLTTAILTDHDDQAGAGGQRDAVLVEAHLRDHQAVRPESARPTGLPSGPLPNNRKRSTDSRRFSGNSEVTDHEGQDGMLAFPDVVPLLLESRRGRVVPTGVRLRGARFQKGAARKAPTKGSSSGGTLTSLCCASQRPFPLASADHDDQAGAGGQRDAVVVEAHLRAFQAVRPASARPTGLPSGPLPNNWKRGTDSRRFSGSPEVNYH